VLTKYTFQDRDKASNYWDPDNLKDDRYTTNKIINLLIVDPQNDYHRSGTLPVQGADEDSKRIAAFIKNNKVRIHNIIVTLESRAQYHISHQLFWKDQNGSPPKLFTIITSQDIRNKVWIPRDAKKDVLEWCLTYTINLEEKGMRKLTIWPEHCIVGSKGHAVVPVINEALQEWATMSNRPVKYVMKCQNWKTESYSALEAEIIDPADFSTHLNMELLYSLRMSDQVYTVTFGNLFFLDGALYVAYHLRPSSDSCRELYYSRCCTALAGIRG
jgi:nicotinamidase-related amidase